jgi:hypothetical protein
MKQVSLLFAVLLLVLSFTATAQVPNKISYQGLLTTSVGTPVADGSYNLQFDIYNLPSSGDLRHTETFTGVALSKGSFSVILHPPTTIFAESLFVEVTALSGPGISGSITFSPRSVLTSAPYSLAPWITSGSNIYYMNGNVGIGTASPNDQLEITGNLRLPATTATTGVINVGADRFIHNYGIQNTFIGLNAGNLTMTGYSNTAIGESALHFNTTGYDNTANGRHALYHNTIGNYNTANGSGALNTNTTGNDNTANGSNALLHNTTGNDNTAVGYQSLYSNTVGPWNTATGAFALFSNTGGYFNTANGSNALYNNTTGYENTAVGKDALYTNTTGSDNTANGYQSLYSNTTGSNNIANGAFALVSNTTGNNNTANGMIALKYSTTGNDNTANGTYALKWNNTGNDNTANGYSSLYSNATGHDNTANGSQSLSGNTEGNYNTANGSSTLVANETGNYNTAIGFSADVGAPDLTNATAIGAFAFVSQSNSIVLGSIAGQNGATSNTNVGIGTTSPNDQLEITGNLRLPATTATTGVINVGADRFIHNYGIQNTFIGLNAGNLTMTGGYNTANGYGGLMRNTTGSYNTATGSGALYNNITGYSNTANGESALLHNTGYENTAVGKDALRTNTTGYDNTAIGFSANVAANNLINATAIGAGAIVNATNTMVFGNGSVVGWGFGAIPPPGHAFQVGSNGTNGNGAFLTIGGAWTNGSDRNKKENITSVDAKGLLNKIEQLPITMWNYKGESKEIRHIGPMAQDFYEIFGLGNDDKHISTIDPSGVALAAIQELHKENSELKDRLSKLEAIVKSLAAQQKDPGNKSLGELK